MDAGQPLSESGVAPKPSGTPFLMDTEERLKFEMLIADLSARFLDAPADQIDTEIRDAQRRVVDALSLDRSSLWKADERQPGAFRLTSLYEADRPVIKRAPSEMVSSQDWMLEDQSEKTPIPLGMDARVFFPWICEQTALGRTVALASLDDLPAEAARDREIYRLLDTKSTLTVPLRMGGGVIGVVTFATIRAERAWPEPPIERFQTIARLFAEVLARSSADRELRASEARLSLAAESAGARFWELDMRTGRLWVTNAARQLYEIAPEEDLTFARYLELVHPEDRERVRGQVENRVQVGEDLRLEYRVLRPDGRVEWVAA